jgi:8-oxo-dGTP pyrophosphatase MutT (NUDIX family)
MYVRRSARVALFAPDGTVLLMRSRFRRVVAGVEWAWFLPGGGVLAHETIREAAVREVSEETGLNIDTTDLTHLAFAEGQGTVGDVVGPMRDDIFAASATPVPLTTERMEPHEVAGVDEFRWWPLSALCATVEVVFPRKLPEVLHRFAAATSWPQPVQLPW